MPKTSCNACGKFISATGAAHCSKCASLFHKGCVMIPESTAVSKGWVCPECTTPKQKCDNTPVRAASTAVGAAHETSKATRGMPTVQQDSIHDYTKLHKEMAEWMMEMRDFRREISEFRATVIGMTSRMDSIEARLLAVEEARAEAPNELNDLKCKVVLLQQEVNDREQDALLSDLEIGQLPEEKGENVVHSVTILAARLGVEIKEHDIVFAERVGVAQGASAAGEISRPRRIVVRLARRHLRDQLLQSARVRRTLTAVDAGHDHGATAGATAPPRQRVYLNERLTRNNRIVFHRVREECRKFNWRFSWTARGRVFARQADGKDRYQFRSEEDVARVFGSKPV